MDETSDFAIAYARQRLRERLIKMQAENDARKLAEDAAPPVDREPAEWPLRFVGIRSLRFQTPVAARIRKLLKIARGLGLRCVGYESARDHAA